MIADPGPTARCKRWGGKRIAPWETEQQRASRSRGFYEKTIPGEGPDRAAA